MREYKFRAYHPEWSKIIYSKQDYEFGKREFFPWYFEIGFSNYPEDGWRLMQYTGAKDSNGKEIYEDDIIECEYYPDLPSTKDLEQFTWRGIVEYGETHTHFFIRRTDVENCNIYSVGYGGSAVKRWEVIGNIYENPELLK